jgi:ribosome-associated heat shock protein Hsp15
MNDTQRLDKWLFFSRFVKSRGLAAAWCDRGLVTLNGRPGAKVSQAVRVGDVLILPKGRDIQAVRVLALGERRGPASEARRMYDKLEGES